MFRRPLQLYLQNLRGFSALDSGLLLLPGSLVMGILGPITGKLIIVVSVNVDDFNTSRFNIGALIVNSRMTNAAMNIAIKVSSTVRLDLVHYYTDSVKPVIKVGVQLKS
jgi:hypothetical protein